MEIVVCKYEKVLIRSFYGYEKKQDELKEIYFCRKYLYHVLLFAN